MKINKQKVPKFGPNVNGSYNPLSSDFQLLMPGKSLNFLLEGYLQWRHNKLNFIFLEKNGSYWIFSDFNPDTYSITFTYENQYKKWEQRSFYNDPIDFQPVLEKQVSTRLKGNMIQMEDVWVGKISTPPIDFHLLE